MKKNIILFSVLLLISSFLQAQSIVFLYNGEVLEDGATVTFNAEKNPWGGAGFEAGTNSGTDQLEISNLASSAVTFFSSVEVVSNDVAANLQWCGLDEQCNLIADGYYKKGPFTWGAGKNGYMVLDARFEEGVYGTVKVKASVSVGLVSRIVYIDFVYSSSSGVESVENGISIKTMDNELVYNFSTDASRQLNLYNVTGERLRNQHLNTAGSVSLRELPKGIYLYEVLENGKRIAARKCIVD